MRSIGQLDQEGHAARFSVYLKKQGIGNQFEADNGGFTIWIESEDQVEKAIGLLEEFQKDPEAQKYLIPISSLDTGPKQPSAIASPSTVIAPVRKKVTHVVTIFLVGLCVFIYFLNLLQEFKIAKNKEKPSVILLTPVQFALLYDVPTSLVELSKLLEENPIDPKSSMEELPPEIQSKIEAIERMPSWRGLYHLILNKLQKKPTYSGEMFIKIRQGQLWRLFTPTILHKDLLHILFNMLWLWVLGRQMEEKLSRTKMCVIIVIVAILSNTGQYLVSGPLFLGFSGVVMGMAGFIWIRQKVAPWEGYSLHRTTFLFLGIFVLAMLALQVFSFIVQVFGAEFLSINIANTAHIVGGVAGILLGRLSLFSWRPLER